MKTALMTLVLVLLCSSAKGQDISGGQQTQVGFMDLRKSVIEKRVMLVRHNMTEAQQVKEVNNLLAESSGHLSFLRELSNTRNVPKEYALGMVDDLAILQGISRLGRIGQPQWEQLQALNSDLRVKANHAVLGGESGFKLIEVVVRTKKNGKELSNYQVWYVKEAYKNNPTKYQTFDSFSSPSIRKIPPGRYLMWTQATDESKAQGDKTPKEFGDGQGRVETDLTAP